jgi:hypothetical protein
MSSQDATFILEINTLTMLYVFCFLWLSNFVIFLEEDHKQGFHLILTSIEKEPQWVRGEFPLYLMIQQET